ncbi:MAG: hypothetical protein ACOC95_00800 [Planctomycetota bacterium]
MKALIALVVSILRILLPWAVKQSRPTAGDADPDRETRDRLREQIRKHWVFVIVAVPLVMVGCGVRTVYVPHGTPVRLRETVEDVKVWVKDSDGQAVAGRMDLPEGWFALPLEEE